MKLTLTAVFHETDNGYIAFVEELPGAEAKGATLEEARKNLAEAAYIMIEQNRKSVTGKLNGKAVVKEAMSLNDDG